MPEDTTEPAEQMSPTVKKAAEKMAPEPESRTFTAPAGTEIATQVTDTGERVDISFESGSFTTSDEAVIAVLSEHAADPDHPIQEG